jgi:hypothetical protein
MLIELIRLGLAQKVTDIIIENGGGDSQEDWWSVRKDTNEMCLEWDGEGVESFAHRLVSSWIRTEHDLVALAWEWADSQVSNWTAQQCIDYAGLNGVDNASSYCYAKALIKFQEQVFELWSADLSGYEKVWRPLIPYNKAYNQISKLLTECPR